MADFLVTIDGQYISYGYLEGASLAPNYTLPFDYLNFDVIYDDTTGRVWAYKDFISVYGKNTHFFRGYYNYNEFYLKSFKTYDNTGQSVLAARTSHPDDIKHLDIHSQPAYYNDHIPKSKNDRIYLVQRKIELDGTEYFLKVKVKSFNNPNTIFYNEILFMNITDNYIKDIGKIAWKDESFNPNFSYTTETIPFKLPELSTYAKNIKAKKFLTADGSSTRNLYQSEIETVEDISIIFDRLFRIDFFVDFLDVSILRFIFDRHFDIINDEDFNIVDQHAYHRDFNHPYFLGLRTRLLEFYYWVKREFRKEISPSDIQKYKMETLTWIFGLFNEETLREIDYVTKVGLLQLLVENGLTRRYNPFRNSIQLTTSETAVKIVRSIYKTVNGQPYHYDINNFLDYMNKGRFDSKDHRNVFRVLYEEIKDPVFFNDDGTGARGQFVNAVYELWMVSRYNPSYDPNYDNPQIIPVEHVYLPLDPTLNVFYEDNLYNHSKIYLKYKGGNDNTATSSPMELDYEADKFLFWYKDNFNFDFVDNKIRAIQKSKKISYTNHGAEVNVTVKRFYGFYDIFQPVAVSKINTDTYTNETIIRLPINVNMNTNNPCELADGINNMLPVFYLKYVDQLQDINNLKATLDITAEIAITATMIGNISKLRYLRYSNNMFRLITLTPLTAAETLALSRACLTIFGTAETVVQFVGLIHRLKTLDCTVYNPCIGSPPDPGTPGYEAWEKCKYTQKVILAVNIFTMTGSLASLKSVRTSSRKLAQLGPNLPPADIDLLFEMGGMGNQYTTFTNKLSNEYNSIFIKFNNQTNEVKHAFYYDFQTQFMGNEIIKFTDEMFDNWGNLRLVQAFDEAKDIEVLGKNLITNLFEKFYGVADLAEQLKLVSLERRKSLMKMLGELSPTNFNKFVTDNNLVNRFMKYSDNVTTNLWFSKLDETQKFMIVEELVDLPDDLFKGFVRNPSKFNEYVNLNTAGRQLLKNNKYFWLRHNLDFNDVVKVDVEINTAKDKVIKRNGQTWFTDTNKRPRAERFLNDGSSWSIGEVVELMGEKFLRAKLNNKTEVFKSVEIKWQNANNQIFGARIEEIDALIYNSVSNKFDVLVSIKTSQNEHKIRRDINKLIAKMKDLPDSGQQLHDYILNVLKTPNYVKNPSSINEVVSARIIYKDIRTGNEVIVLPSQFSNKIPNSIDNSIMIHPEVLGTTKNEIVDSAYRSMVIKFLND